MQDRLYFKKGIALLAGTDEAGRGPWAGPVYAAAVILPQSGTWMNELNDSKQLTAKKRDMLYDRICQYAISYAIASASVQEIDALNIRQASFLAMNRALAQLSPTPEHVVSDGFPIPDCEFPNTGHVKGDARFACIAAASILAKVARDRYMHDVHQRYPQYHFEKHKGYGTALHQQALKDYGVCPEHRVSFKPIKQLLSL